MAERDMIISISGKKRAGKSTVADYISGRWGFLEVSWAYPLKEIIGKQIFGLTQEQIYGSNADRERIIPEWNLSSRQILQKVGTDMFRNNIDKDIWVKWGLRYIDSIFSRLENSVVVSDTRFPNELECLKKYSEEKKITFASINIVRKGLISEDTHSSENALEGYPFDYIIEGGDGELKWLYAQIEHILLEIKRCH